MRIQKDYKDPVPNWQSLPSLFFVCVQLIDVALHLIQLISVCLSPHIAGYTVNVTL